MENFYEVYNTASEVGAYANYDGAARKYNVVALGNGENPQDPIDLAPASCAYPKCGERNIDNLALEDDEVVTCQTCGTEYDISNAARLDRVMLDDCENWSDHYALAHPGALM